MKADAMPEGEWGDGPAPHRLRNPREEMDRREATVRSVASAVTLTEGYLAPLMLPEQPQGHLERCWLS